MMLAFILLTLVYSSYVYGHSGNAGNAVALLNPRLNNYIALPFVLSLVVTSIIRDL